MEMIKSRFTRLQNDIFGLMSIRSGEKLNLSDIAKSLKVSVTAVSKAIKDLEESRLIKVERDKKMNLTLVSLDRSNKKTIQLKRVDNLKRVYDSGLSDYLEEGYLGATIILFGSYSRGDDTIQSDLDIAVIGRKEKKLDLKKFEEKLNREIIINYYPSFKEIHKHLKENIFNGIILAGGVEI